MNSKLQLIFSRRSVRQFAAEPVTDEQVQDLLHAAMAAPSACAKDPWRFVVIRDKNMLGSIASGLPNGKMLPAASLGILVCGDLQAAHGGELSYLLQDCSAAIENLLLAASALGLGACWLGVHPRQDRIAHIRNLLLVPDHVIPVAAIAVGCPAENPAPRTRYRKDFVFAESWQ